MSEFWCSALKPPVAQPCGVSPLPMLLAIQSGKEKCLSLLLSPPTPCSLSYSVSKSFEWKQGKKVAQGSNSPFVLTTGDSPSLAFQVERLPSFHGPGATGANRPVALGRTREDGPKLCQIQHARAVCVPSNLRALPKGSTCRVAPVNIHRQLHNIKLGSVAKEHLRCFEQASF